MPVNLTFHKKIFEVTEKLKGNAFDPESVSPQELDIILAEVCGALRQSLDNGLEEIFREAMDAGSAPRVIDEANAVIKEAGAFAEFLQFERKALLDCGVSEAVAGHIVSRVQKLREFLIVPINADEAVKAVKRASDEICIASSQARGTITTQRKRAWVRFGGAFSTGVALNLANAAATTFTLGVATPFVALSHATGGAMIGSAALLMPASRPGRT